MGLYRSKNITAAKRTADRWFSLYIRLRDADKDGNIKCVTCGAEYHFNDNKIDAGHFIEADNMATRYHECNVHSQCKACNLSANGKMYQHGEAIKILHGEEIPDGLIKESKTTLKYDKKQLMVLARLYKSWCIDLAKTKNIEI
jgi:hypothetical protein